MMENQHMASHSALCTRLFASEDSTLMNEDQEEQVNDSETSL